MESFQGVAGKRHQMLYTEPKEKSAEWLRAALAEMARHDAAFHPVTYTVFYEHVAGMNARLSDALLHFCETEGRLSDATVQRLYREHIAGVDDKTMDRISRDFQQVMAGMAETVRRTGDRAGAFGAQLHGLTTALQAEGSPVLQQHVEQALRHSQDMQHSAAALQAQVDASEREIERLRADLQRAREEVFLDSLTRVLNRKGLDHQLDRLLHQSKVPNVSHGLVMLDIDHFKHINDQHGHLVGDQVLAAMGELLRLTVTDPGYVVARYGGEEFAILLPHATLERTAQLAERVRNQTKAMKLRKRNAPDVVLSITVSAGAALWRGQESANDWLGRADAALYQSKQGGRDRVSLAA